MDHKKLDITCPESEGRCYLYRKGKCTLDLARFQEQKANDTLTNLPCLEYLGTSLLADVERQLAQEAKEKEQNEHPADDEWEGTESDLTNFRALFTGKYNTFGEYEDDFTQELQRTANSFVRIGYLLKGAKFSDILKDTPYKDHLDFAEKKFGLEKSTVSRFMRINTRFSEGGCSDHLLPEFQAYGYTKLSVMLQLPDEVIAELSPSYSKSEIIALKEEYLEEQKTSDLEILMQKQEEGAEPENLLDEVVYQLLKTDTGLYRQLRSAHYTAPDLPAPDLGQRLYEVIAPYGESIHMVLVPGTGRVMLSVKGMNLPVTVTVMRSGVKENYKFEELMGYLEDYICLDGGEAGFCISWENVFKEPWPEQTPDKPEDTQKSLSRKESKVTKAVDLQKKEAEKSKVAPVQPKPVQITLHNVAPQIPEPDPKEEETGSETAADEKITAGQEDSGDKQIPGQDEITNHPEYLPADQVETIPPENGIKPECGADSSRENGIPGLTVDERTWIWNNAADAHNHLDSFFEHWSGEIHVSREALKKAYNEAIQLASGLERLLIDAESVRRQEESDE